MTTNELLKGFRPALKKNVPSWCSSMLSKADIYDYTIDNQKIFRLGFSTAHPGKDGITLNINLRIGNDEIFQIVKESGVFPSKQHPIIFASGRWNVVPEKEWDRYFIAEHADLNIVTKELLDDIHKYYFSVAKKLTVDYSDALPIFSDSSLLMGFGEPFITGVIIAFLNKNEKWIYDTLIPLTEKYKKIGDDDSQERFYKDYRQTDNPEKTIIEPIRKWFETSK